MWQRSSLIRVTTLVLVVLRGTGAVERDTPLKRALQASLAPVDYVPGGKQLTLVEWAARPAATPPR